MKAIKTYYLPATNFRGSRIVATTLDHNRLVINQPVDLDVGESFEFAAYQLCKKMDWKGKLLRGSFPKFDVFVFERGK